MNHIFISYSTEDDRYAFKLAGALEKDGFNVWIDDSQVGVGSDIPSNIRQGIKTCSIFVLLASPSARASNWVQSELNLAIATRRKIFPLLLDGNIEAWSELKNIHFEAILDRLVLPSHDFFERLKKNLPGYLRLLVEYQSPDGNLLVKPGEYAISDPDLFGLEDELIHAGYAVWIDVSPFRALQVTEDSVVSSGRTVKKGVYAPEDLRLWGAADELLRSDRAGWTSDEPVADGPLSKPLGAVDLPLLEWCAIPGGERIGNKRTFRISKYPVTNAQYKYFLQHEDGYGNKHWWNYSAQAREYHTEHPVPREGAWPEFKRPRVNVSWFDAVAFCRWLSTYTGLSIFLPTGEEWQYAAQGTDGLEYPWGNRFDSQRCNTEESGINKTSDVDRFTNGASPFGVCDMSGNVWEWCFTNYITDVNNDARGSEERQERGGSWHFSQREARTFVRVPNKPRLDDDNVGFRLACYS